MFDRRAIQAPAVSIINVLDARTLFESGVLQPPPQRPVLFPYPLPINEEGKALFEAELLSLWLPPLFFVGLAHAIEFHPQELLHGLFM